MLMNIAWPLCNTQVVFSVLINFIMHHLCCLFGLEGTQSCHNRVGNILPPRQEIWGNLFLETCRNWKLTCVDSYTLRVMTATDVLSSLCASQDCVSSIQSWALSWNSWNFKSFPEMSEIYSHVLNFFCIFPENFEHTC